MRSTIKYIRYLALDYILAFVKSIPSKALWHYFYETCTMKIDRIKVRFHPGKGEMKTTHNPNDVAFWRIGGGIIYTLPPSISFGLYFL